MVRYSLKTCRLCLVDKPLDCFYKHPETKDRLRNECKDCWKELTNKYIKANTERVVENRRKNHYKRNYNLSLEELDKMKEETKRCLICKKELPLVVDHDHNTGKIRGLLCAKCNQGLGCFDESIENFENAIAYIKDHLIMPTYVADFEYKITEWGSVTLDADTAEQASDMAYDYVKETYPDVYDIDVTSVAAVNNLGR